MAESECGALVGPGERNPLQQQLDRQRARLAVFDNGLDNVGRKIGRPQKPVNMGVAQTEASRNFDGIAVFATS